jgi:hypothetical protein
VRQPSVHNENGGIAKFALPPSQDEYRALMAW